MPIDLGGLMPGVREGVIALITLVAVYMLVVVLRMRRLRRRDTVAQATTSEGEPSPVADKEQVASPERTPIEDWEPVPSGLAEEVLRRGLEQEVAQLREELDAVRGELAALRADMLQELGHMRATQAVSPIYGDAMQMAAAGYDPAVIAERCGIARAEAELVVALAKSQER